MGGSNAEKDHGRLVVLYDGYCPVCRRSAELIRQFDVLKAIDLRKYQDFPLSELPVSLDRLGKRVHACKDGFSTCSEGIFAFASIMLRIPPLFIPALFCLILGFSGIGQKFYDFISDNRYNLPFTGFSRFLIHKKKTP